MMAKAPTKPQTFKVNATPVKQGKTTMYTFVMKVEDIYRLFAVTQRDPDQQKGYQRALVPKRVKEIVNYIESGDHSIPNAIIVAVNSDLPGKDGQLCLRPMPDSDHYGWIVDGQHRIYSLKNSATGKEYELVVNAFINLSVEEQIHYFVTVNKEAKNVSASLFLDLLREVDIPKHKIGDWTKQRCVEIAVLMKESEHSPFSGRISMTGRRSGEISLVNFVRKYRQFVHPQTGLLNQLSPHQQQVVIDVFHTALIQKYPVLLKKELIFKTLHFGALAHLFPEVVRNVWRMTPGKFDLSKVIEIIPDDFNFETDAWSGSGSSVESDRGGDLISQLHSYLQENSLGQKFEISTDSLNR